MKVLFLHRNFPAQFRHLAIALSKDPNNQIVFATNRKEGKIPGVHKIIYEPSRGPSEHTHDYVRSLEGSVLAGQAVYRRLLQLNKKQGFYPDVIYAHAGWGPGLFMKDLFPKATYLCFFEWFYHAYGSDADFDPAEPIDENTAAKLRIRNASLLIELSSCDRGLSPTRWQQQQFPPELQSKLAVCHDGIDTDFFKPSTSRQPTEKQTKQPNKKLANKLVIKPPKPIACSSTLDLSAMEEVITYVARGMEPYRGFPQFMEAVSLLQKQRPNCHAVIVGEDWVAYGKQLPNGQTYRQQALDTLELDLSRIHFTGHLPYSQYLQVIQASSVHVYLTRPFVLSWSMLEAMSTGCLVLGSKTPPVEEVIQDGVNGLLVDFFSPAHIVERIIEVLEHPDNMQAIRAQARKTIVENYNLADLLPRHLSWMRGEKADL